MLGHTAAAAAAARARTGGSGIGNGLWGFVQAFAQSLLSGKEQPEQLS